MRRRRTLVESALLWLLLWSLPALLARATEPFLATALAFALLLLALVGTRSRVDDLPRRRSAPLFVASTLAGWLTAPLLGSAVRRLGTVVALEPVAPVRFADLPVAATLSALVLAPWVEELLYRERMFAALARRGLPIAAGITTLAFALPHRSVWTMLAACVGGLLLAASMWAARSVALCTGVHTGWNAFGVVHGVPLTRVDGFGAVVGIALLAAAIGAARRARRSGLVVLTALPVLTLPEVVRADALEVEAALRFEPTASAMPAPEIEGVGVATVNGSAGGIALETLSLAGGVAGATIVPVTDPLVSVGGLVAVGLGASLGSGSLGPFRPSSPPLSGRLTRASLPLAGSLRLCMVFTGCGLGLTFGLLDTLSGESVGVGVGGLVTAYPLSSVMLSLQGAPWTVGAATLPVTTSGGGQLTLSTVGAVHGPYSFTGSTALPGGEVQLVTPIRVTSSGSVPTTGAFFARLTLRFVPEPRSLVVLPPAGLLLWLGSRRRR